jgi:hypothetical protein
VRLRTNENWGMTCLSGFLDHLRVVVGTKSGP